MADTSLPTGLDAAYRNTTYGTQTDYDAYVNRWAEKDKLDQLYEDKTTLSFTDMLGLMVKQFQNQSMDNQASTTDMMNQLVQMTSMQAMTELTTKMDEMLLANVMGYAASLVGQTVTIGVYDSKGNLNELVGVVEGTGTYNGEQVIYVNGKGYYLSEIMAVGKLPPKVEEDPDTGDDSDDTETPPPTGDGDGDGE